MVVRQAGTWDPLLGPCTLCCNTCTWTYLSSSNKIQRNCTGLKITSACSVGANSGPKDTKRPKNPTATFEEPGAKAGYCTCPLHTTPPKGWAKHLSRPSGLTPGHTPTRIPYKKQACPPPWGESQQGNLLFVLTLPAAGGAPIEPCLNFLSGLWSISID